VQDWRKEHPQYWRRCAKVADALNGGTRDLRAVLVEFFTRYSCDALQDSWPPQVVALVGLIAWLRGDALQDTIAADIKEIMLRGNDLLVALPVPPTKQRTSTSRDEH
jgi:hypothetical protein